MRVGTPCNGKIRSEPHLYRSGRGVAGWRADKHEMKDRKAFQRLPLKAQARIEAEKLKALRETINSILE